MRPIRMVVDHDVRSHAALSRHALKSSKLQAPVLFLPLSRTPRREANTFPIVRFPFIVGD